MKIGFIGLGLMGTPMTRNLLTSRAILTVNNRTASKCTPLVALGAKASPSPREMAKQVGDGIIVLCVNDTPALCAALSGPEGMLDEIAPSTLVIDMGTTEVSTTKQMAHRVEQAGGRYLDAPVSGGEVGARDATLSIMVGGAPEDVERTRPIFNVLGKLLTHIGPVGTSGGRVAMDSFFIALSFSCNFILISNVFA
jgi:2-hydroxy-3-oxopropionate reductase